MTQSIVSGSCFCGAVRFEIELPTVFCGHCHCSMCRRPHGASYVTWTGVPPERFKITKGEEYLASYQSSEHGVRRFCRTCGSQMLCQTEPEVIDIALAALHGDIDRKPEAHYYYDSRAPWTHVNDELPKLGGEDGMQPLPDDEPKV
ncbi:MAG: GFA family protein [Kiloniellales bacterium]|nr:GFA family protein [Kiloniellales bacterium]